MPRCFINDTEVSELEFHSGLYEYRIRGWDLPIVEVIQHTIRDNGIDQICYSFEDEMDITDNPYG